MSKYKVDLSKILVDENSILFDKNYNKVSKIHKYWSRKPWYIIKDYISKYSVQEDLILDPFCGSGIIGLESILQKRNFIGYDLNPFAVFLSNQTLDFEFDIIEFKQEIDNLVDTLKKPIMDIYAVSDDQYVLYNILGHGNKKDYNCVLCNYNFKNKIKTSRDHSKQSEVFIDFSFPDKPFPKKFHKDRFSYKGIVMVSDMFTNRNLKALSIIHDYISKNESKYKNLLQLALTNTLLHVSKLKGENVRPLGVNNYWIPDDFIEENVMWRFLDRLNNILVAKRTIISRINSNKTQKTGSFVIHNKSSLPLTEIPDSSIDYIVTDPPYGEAIQYSELSYIWNTWLSKNYHIEEEVIINPVQNKGINEFHDAISEFINNSFRVLKTGHYFTLCFHNKEVKIWAEIIRKIRDTGFELADIKIYDVFGSPYNKHWSKFSPKSDLYVTFRKSEDYFLKNIVEIGKVDPLKIAVSIKKQLNQNNSFDLNKAYDLFVAQVIVEIFEGNSCEDILKLDIKKIANLFES